MGCQSPYGQRRCRWLSLPTEPLANSVTHPCGQQLFIEHLLCARYRDYKERQDRLSVPSESVLSCLSSMRQARRHVTQTGKKVQSKGSAGLRSHKLSDITRIRASIASVWATLRRRPRRHKREDVTGSLPRPLLPSIPFFNTLFCDYTDSGGI